jgi:hypothetical protein
MSIDCIDRFEKQRITERLANEICELSGGYIDSDIDYDLLARLTYGSKKENIYFIIKVVTKDIDIYLYLRKDDKGEYYIFKNDIYIDILIYKRSENTGDKYIDLYGDIKTRTKRMKIQELIVVSHLDIEKIYYDSKVGKSHIESISGFHSYLDNRKVVEIFKKLKLDKKIADIRNIIDYDER